MTNLRNMITAGLAGLVLASGCAASNTSLKSIEESEEVLWTEGARNTGIGYEGIGCNTSSDRYLASQVAQTKARVEIIFYVAKEQGQAKVEDGSTSARGDLYGSRVQDEQRIQKNGRWRICSKVAVPYSGVQLR